MKSEDGGVRAAPHNERPMGRVYEMSMLPRRCMLGRLSRPKLLFGNRTTRTLSKCRALPIAGFPSGYVALKWCYDDSSRRQHLQNGRISSARKNEFPEPIQRDATSPVSIAKIYFFATDPNHPYNSRHPVPVEGRWPSSRTLGRDALDAAASGA
jgi:hypothetical protein